MEQQANAPQDIRNVVNFLRSSKAGMKIRVGILNGKRVDYFKGKSAVKALLSPAFSKLKNVPKVTTEQEAQTLLLSIIPYAFYLRVERGAPSGSSSSSPKQLQITQIQAFQPPTIMRGFMRARNGRHTSAVSLWSRSCWPESCSRFGRPSCVSAYGTSVSGCLVLLSGHLDISQMFADVGFVESFIPLWEWDLPKKKTKKKRNEKSGKAPAAVANGSSPSPSRIEEVPDSGSSRPESRNTRVEEVPEES
ncbi:Translocation protein sec62 [Grifola frondosa]|uniref:Translocation protein SEC62 n=1 Tax=Grifola frondosa TaxID=5627 RepID=A0A1C7LRW5_GRIFR|nr:Translocation protein sec62 [Grifola frondosa]